MQFKFLVDYFFPLLAGVIGISLFFYGFGVKQQAVMVDKFGIPDNEFSVQVDTLRSSIRFSDLLAVTDVPGKKRKSLFNLIQAVDTLKKGTIYRIYRNTKGDLRHLVYDSGPGFYKTISFTPEITIAEGKYKPVVKKRAVAGRVSQSMFQTIRELGMTREFVERLSQIFAWEIDFYKLEHDDTFKAVYEQYIVDGKVVGTGNILAASFTHNHQTFYAFYFEHNGDYGYYDENGKLLKKNYLQAPLEYSYITSEYSKNRFHPILKEYIPHLGTDYAAPSGTPVRAVGNGMVIKAGSSPENGLYIKVEHNSVYATGYLHLSKIADGVKTGTRIIQGQIIGYVGSTGLATGPHLCFRFWKDGEQVDPFSEKTSSDEHISNEYREVFSQKVKELKEILEELEISETDRRFFATGV